MHYLPVDANVYINESPFPLITALKRIKERCWIFWYKTIFKEWNYIQNLLMHFYFLPAICLPVTNRNALVYYIIIPSLKRIVSYIYEQIYMYFFLPTICFGRASIPLSLSMLHISCSEFLFLELRSEPALNRGGWAAVVN